MDGAEVRITPTQSGKPGTNAVDLDCCDVIVTYTPAGGGRLLLINPPGLDGGLGGTL